MSWIITYYNVDTASKLQGAERTLQDSHLLSLLLIPRSCLQVAQGLYIGSAWAEMNEPALTKAGITDILQVGHGLSMAAAAVDEPQLRQQASLGSYHHNPSAFAVSASCISYAPDCRPLFGLSRCCAGRRRGSLQSGIGF